jgi:hypothetical protein
MRQILKLNRASSLSRLVRGLWPDRNPVRRATDRTETAIVAGLIATFLVGAPIAALTAGHFAGAAGLRAEQMARYKVQATLLRNAPPPIYSPYGQIVLPTLARWAAPDGSSRIGLVNAESAAHAGTEVTIWTSESGRLIGPPPPRNQVTMRAALMAAAAVVILGAGLLLSGLVAMAAVNRRRLAAWDAAWQRSGPRWTSRA